MGTRRILFCFAGSGQIWTIRRSEWESSQCRSNEVFFERKCGKNGLQRLPKKFRIFFSSLVVFNFEVSKNAPYLLWGQSGKWHYVWKLFNSPYIVTWGVRTYYGQPILFLPQIHTFQSDIDTHIVHSIWKARSKISWLICWKYKTTNNINYFRLTLNPNDMNPFFWFSILIFPFVFRTFNFLLNIYRKAKTCWRNGNYSKKFEKKIEIMAKILKQKNPINMYSSIYRINVLYEIIHRKL